MIGNRKVLFQTLFFTLEIGSSLLFPACATVSSQKICGDQLASLQREWEGAEKGAPEMLGRALASQEALPALQNKEIKYWQKWSERRIRVAQGVLDHIEQLDYSEAQIQARSHLGSEITQLTFLFGNAERGDRKRVQENFEEAGAHHREVMVKLCQQATPENLEMVKPK